MNWTLACVVLWVTANSASNCHKLQGIKFIRQHWLSLNHLRQHKFKHNFQDSINPLCQCSQDTVFKTHFFLHCPLYINGRCTLLSTVNNLDCNLLHNTNAILTQTLFFGNTSFTSIKNSEILIATFDFIFRTKRFDEALF